MKKIFTLSLAFSIMLIIIASSSYAQDANVTLSNLSSPTAINQNLLPNKDNKLNLGASAKGWKRFYLTDGIYHDTFRVFFADTTNVAVGTSSLMMNTGQANTAVGAQALHLNSSGLFNTAAGILTLSNNTLGSANTAIGGSAMSGNTTGNYNTATGFYALSLNTSGSNNVAYGDGASYSNTLGYSNVAVGSKALYKNKTASGLVAIGDSALLNNTTGSENNALGKEALEYNNTGSGNAAFGSLALYFNKSGNNNSAIGNEAMQWNSSGNQNTATGYAALYDNTSGSYNTSTGYLTLYNNTKGSYNSAFGYLAGVHLEDLVNATAIGAGADVDESNKIRIGNTYAMKIGGQVGWSVFSDGRYKQNIKENVPGLEFVNKLRPITYTVNIDELNKHYRGNLKPGSEKAKQLEKFDETMKSNYDKASKIVYTGFVAQEVEKASNELNYDFNGVDKPETKDNLYGLRYDEFVVPLVKAVQELSKKNDEKDSKIDELQIQLTKQQNEIDELKTLITTGTQSSFSTKQQMNISISSARLEQNQPNPTKQSTIIKYFIPEQTIKAVIKITNANSQEIKSINISQKSSGQINLQTNDLTAGTYFYSLIVDGKTIDTKKMVIAR